MRGVERRFALLVLAALLSGAACGGKLSTDNPLAPVPTKVDPRDVEPSPLQVQWTQVADEDAEAPTQKPALDDSHGYLIYDDLLRAVALGDGETAWEVQMPTTIALPALPVAGGVAVLTTDGRWSWFDNSGRMNANAAVGSSARDATVVPDGIVQLDHDGVSLIAGWIDDDGPTRRWSTAIDGARTVTRSRLGAALYVVDDGGVLTALATDTGRLLWQSAEGRAIAAHVAVDARLLYVLGSDDRLRALKQTDGRQAWLGKATGSRSAAAPAVVDGVVWVSGLDASIHGFDAETGSHLFRLKLAGRSYLDLVSWGRWVIASPLYGPWAVIRAPLKAVGPTDPGTPRQLSIGSTGDIELGPGVGVAGVLVVDAGGTVRLLQPSS